MAVLDWLQQLLGGGDPEAAGAAQASAAMQPMTQPWLDKVLSGEMARSGIQDVNDAFASRDPVALAGSFGPTPLGIRGFHGSPHLFAPEPGAPLGRFRWDKIGTGEGAQAYGYAPAYVAENEAVARTYRDTLSPRPAGLSDAGYDVAQYWLKEHGGDNAAANKAYLDYAGPHADPAVAAYLAKQPGHMYEVDINAKPEDFLHLDKPLNEQGQTVQQAVDKLLPASSKEPMSASDLLKNFLDTPYARQFPEASDVRIARRVSENPEPGEIADWAAKQIDSRSSAYNLVGSVGSVPGTSTGTQVLERLKQALSPNDERVLAEKLREAGIPGTRYLDQGSRAADQGSANYAIWTPELITILRRYGLLPPLAAGGGLLAAPGHGEAAPP